MSVHAAICAVTPADGALDGDLQTAGGILFARENRPLTQMTCFSWFAIQDGASFATIRRPVNSTLHSTRPNMRPFQLLIPAINRLICEHARYKEP